jgi:hypothetical protein
MMGFIIGTLAGMLLRGQWTVRDVHVILSANELRTTARGHTCKFEWSSVWRIGQTDKHVFLYVLRDAAIIIPRRAFRDDWHFDEFVALARQYQQERGLRPKESGIITSLPPQANGFYPMN